MKKIIAICAVVLATSGCGKIDSAIQNVESAAGMLNRTVTLYANDGHVIKSWETTDQISYGGPVAKFVDKNGVNVRVSGTFIIEGK